MLRGDLASLSNRFGSQCLPGENRFRRYRRKGSAIWSLGKARGNELGRTEIPAIRVRTFPGNGHASALLGIQRSIDESYGHRFLQWW